MSTATEPAGTPPPAASDDVILSVQNLSTSFRTDRGVVNAVNKASFELRKGESVGLVGESGCGKSVTSKSIMRLLPEHVTQYGADSRILLDGVNLLDYSEKQMRGIRGNRIAMIFQEPMTALNPVHTIGRQLTEGMLLHRVCKPENALREAAELLDRVGIPSPDVRLGEYPHQLSGGMRQRVVIAMALACRPALLIADEPTTALDVTIQAQILALIKDLQSEMGMAVIMITHDLGVIAETCSQVVVMYAGKVVESGSVFDIFDRAAHPYSRGLLQAIPRLDSAPKSRLGVIEGMVPGLHDLPAGCRFENRCRHAVAACRAAPPPSEQVAAGHRVSCGRWRDL